MAIIVNNIDDLKQKALSDDFDISSRAFAKLTRSGGKPVVQFLIRMLSHNDIRKRYAAAEGLRKQRDVSAIKPLLRALRDPVNKNHNASFMYALQTHDCGDIFLPIIKIALQGSYELKVHALQILRRQKFRITKRDLMAARNQLRKHKNSSLNNEDYELFVKELSTCLGRIERGLSVMV